MTRRGDARNRHTLSSSRIRTSRFTARVALSSSGLVPRPILSRSRIVEAKAARLLEQELRFIDMNADELLQLRDLSSIIDITNISDDQDDNHDWHMMDGVLRGSTVMAISHHGGDLREVLERLSEECEMIKKRTTDSRTRRDRVQIQVDAFQAQLEGMTLAYMEWNSTRGEDGVGSLDVPGSTSEVELERLMTVVDIFWTRPFFLQVLNTDPTLPAALVRQGLLPSSPLRPQAAFSIRTLELFRVMKLRSPHLGIQSFIKGVCDIHKQPYRAALAQQFTIVYDVYNAILDNVDLKVRQALGRDDPDWRLRNACPSCTYNLKEDPQLELKMLVSMDGNDSLKRVLRRERTLNEDGLPGPSSERTDHRRGGADYFLPRDEVDQWSKDALEDILAPETDVCPCSDRWQNMKNDMSAAMWGLFDESGIFVSLCRHNFVLVVADMVKSGELAKYPLAIVNRLLQVFGSGLCVGYDVGCKLNITIGRTPLADLARSCCLRCVVGLFHGHGHNRFCQLNFLPRYITSTGLENFENCESYFSRSNALAGTTRYSSVFHRHQTITNYIRHIDRFETYGNLSKHLCSNYRQALEILSDGPQLARAMEDLGVSSPDEFPQWLKEEADYLTALKTEPPEEVWRIEYLEKLLELQKQTEALAASRSVFLQDPTAYRKRNATRGIERKQRQKEELVKIALENVHQYEEQHNIDERWVEGSSQWQEAAVLLATRTYRRCLDTLEGLIVARMFELTKMNMSQTGYKQRKHIAKALQVRSQAIRNALDRFNAAAKALGKPQLHWDEVVEYSFLSEFDLLRDSRNDIRTRTWATPAGRMALDRYFKIRGAQQEILRLNMEIQRLVTFMHDEERYLKYHIQQLANVNPPLSYQLHLHYLDRVRYNELHRKRLHTLSRVSGFTGTLSVGTRRDGQLGWDIPVDPSPTTSDDTTPSQAAEGVLDDDEDDDEEVDGITEAVNVLSLLGDT